MAKARVAWETAFNAWVARSPMGFIIEYGKDVGIVATIARNWMQAYRSRGAL